MNQIPQAGEIYQHFKGKLYRIVALATHTETGEQLVIYQALYGEFQVFARPLSMFLEKVDRRKYPDADQEYRFEKVADGFGAGPVAAGAGERENAGQDGQNEPEEELQVLELDEDSPMHPLLLEFLDTESAAERLAILQKMKGKVGQREIDSLCFCLDVKPMDGDLEMQLEHLKQYIRMQQRYDAPRLRWEE